MSNAPKKGTPPQAKRKGGTIFPRIDLEQATKYANKLVSKTHTGAQPPATLFAGVFGASGSRGRIRSSALKQYGLMEGSDKDGYKATQLAVRITTSAPEERTPLVREACLRPKVFAVLFETYHGDEVSIAKIRQQAATTKVHPEELENCAELFVASTAFAGLAKRNGDHVQLVSSAGVNLPERGTEVTDEDEEPDGSETENSVPLDNGSDFESRTKDSPGETRRDSPDGRSGRGNGMPTGRAVIHVNVTLDSSLDTEKLERQLALLRRFGAL